MKKYLVLFFVGLVLVFPAYGSTKKAAANTQKPELREKPAGNVGKVKLDVHFGKIPLYFISNNGQVSKQATFYAKASCYTLWLTKQGLVFDSIKEEKSPYSPHSTKHLRDVSRLVFVNADKNPEMVPVQGTRLRVNYFIGNDRSKWHCNIPTSQAVLYKNLYKNIDLKVYGIDKQIEYDWIVKPCGNPGVIRFAYKNVKTTRIDDEGNLLIETDFGKLIHKKPVCYQRIGVERRTAVNVTFKKVAKDTYGFEVGEYDKRFELIIDPVVLAYSTYCGGGDNDRGCGIAVDNSGYAYVTGYTSSPDFPILDQYQANQTGIDAFVTKIDTTQSGASSLIYSTYLGGDGQDYGEGIAVDGSGYVYVTGYTESSDFPTLDQYQTDQPGGDVFVTKLDTTMTGASSLIYSTYLGGGSTDYGEGITVDTNGNAYVAGYTSSPDFPIRDQYQTDQAGTDTFVTKIDTTRSGASSLIYSTYLGGNHDDYGYGIAVNNNGNAYVTGYTKSSDFPTLDQYQANQPYDDAFITKIDTTQSGTSSLIYSTYLGGVSTDYGYGIAVDGIGYAYVTGFTSSSDFPTLDQYQTDQPYGDAFVTKIDTTQSGASGLIYSTYLGGESTEYSHGIAVDVNSSGTAYVTGFTWSTDFPTLGQYQSDPGDGYPDIFVTKIDTTRSGASSLIYSTYLGGGRGDAGFGIAVDSSGYAYVTGLTDSSDFPTYNHYNTDKAARDAVVTKLIYTPPYPPTVITTPVSSITASSAVSGGNVTSDGGAAITARGICWSASPHPTLSDNVTTAGTGTGAFTSSMTGLTPFTDYFVRAYATNTVGTVYGNEERFTTSVPSLTITSPNGGESWLVGSQHNITWTNDGFQGNVRIEYSIDNGGNWTEIVSSTVNDGFHPWNVPDAVSNQCLISISETNGRPLDISNSVFSIITPPLPSLTVTSPNGGESWLVGSQHNITWTSDGIQGNIKIEYSIDNGGNWTEIVSSTVNDGFHPWTVPDTASNQCLILISGTSGGPLDISDNVFSIITPPLPSLTVTSPNGGESWQFGSTQNITWTAQGVYGSLEITLWKKGILVGTIAKNIDPASGSYTWTVGNLGWIAIPPGTDFKIKIKEKGTMVSDMSDNPFALTLSR